MTRESDRLDQALAKSKRGKLVKAQPGKTTIVVGGRPAKKT